IGGLPSHKRIELPIDLKYRNIKGSISKEVRMGIEQKSSVATSYIGDMEFTRKEEYIMQSLADILRIKLRDAIREEKGGTYNIYCYNRIYRIPQSHYDINFGFGCDPKRVDELVTAFHSVLDSIKTFGPDETVMIKIKESQRRQRELDLKENRFWTGTISDYLENNDDLSMIPDYEKWIDELTAENIKDCANKYLGDDVVKVVLYPGKGS
ncbi:MAG TPA: insulinase family protein, partial [Ignavibacteriaceae bacterium]|nr:insulinase family protein [Ignavibacteriaceae bacterium]